MTNAQARWRAKQVAGPCIIDGCDRLHRPSLLRCPTHQWEFTRSRPVKPCGIEGCGRRKFSNGLCQSHRLRLPGYRNEHIPMDAPIGATRTPYTGVCKDCGTDISHRTPTERRAWGNICKPCHAARNKRRRTAMRCTVEGCERTYAAGGYCAYHRRRFDLTGDPCGTLPPYIADTRIKEPTYRSALWRVNQDRGKARERLCMICASEAVEWGIAARAFDNPDALRFEPYVYSLNVDDYDPMCIPCHRRNTRELSEVQVSERETLD